MATVDAVIADEANAARCILACDALSLANVHAFYGDSHILHGVKLFAAAGGVLALLGRNGAGKTHCISAIIVFENPGPEKSGGLVESNRRAQPRTHLASRDRSRTAGTPRVSVAYGPGKTLLWRSSAKARPAHRGMSTGIYTLFPRYANATRNMPARSPEANSRCL